MAFVPISVSWQWNPSDGTKNIDVGSAVVSILASGGPIAQAERIANTVQFLSHMDSTRKLHVGFSAGRFEFMARPYGIVPRNPVEEASWPALRGQIFMEASEIFLRLLSGETIHSNDVRETVLTRDNFRSDEDWLAVQKAAESDANEILIDRRYQFEEISIVPKTWPRSQLELIAGTHDLGLKSMLTSSCRLRYSTYQLLHLKLLIRLTRG